MINFVYRTSFVIILRMSHVISWHSDWMILEYMNEIHAQKFYDRSTRCVDKCLSSFCKESDFFF